MITKDLDAREEALIAVAREAGEMTRQFFLKPIEVKLKAAVKGNDRLRTTGTLTGQFKIDPYLVKDWLVSLYVMDSGELSDTAGAATPGQHGK